MRSAISGVNVGVKILHKLLYDLLQMCLTFLCREDYTLVSFGTSLVCHKLSILSASSASYLLVRHSHARTTEVYILCSQAQFPLKSISFVLVLLYEERNIWDCKPFEAISCISRLLFVLASDKIMIISWHYNDCFF